MPLAPGTALALAWVMSDPQLLAQALTDVEEEFFRVGNAMSETDAVESFAELDHDVQRPSLWRRLFSRLQDS